MYGDHHHRHHNHRHMRCSSCLPFFKFNQPNDSGVATRFSRHEEVISSCVRFAHLPFVHREDVNLCVREMHFALDMAEPITLRIRYHLAVCGGITAL